MRNQLPWWAPTLAIFIILFGGGCSPSSPSQPSSQSAASQATCPVNLTAKATVKNNGIYKLLSPEVEATQVKLRGHVPVTANTDIDLGIVDGNTAFPLTLSYELNHEGELDTLLKNLYDPSHSQYQQFLSPDAFRERFSPTQAQVDQVTTFLASNGIKVTSVDSNRLLVHAEGKASQIQTAFNTEIHHYQDAQGNVFFAPAYELQVPMGLGIQTVHGIDTQTRLRTHFRRQTPSNQLPFYSLPPLQKPGAQSNSDLSTEALSHSLLTASATSGPIGGFTPSQIVSGYSIPTTLDGSGQTLALFELDGYSASDITAYENYFGLPTATLDNVLLDGATGTPGSGALEVTLDIQLALAVAPKLQKIIVYMGVNTTASALDTYNRIATDNLAKTVSTSWGLYEGGITGATLTAENAIFKQMAAQGQSMFAAAGDSGAYDNGTALSVDDPASQPYVVGVGGTMLTLDSSGNYQSEATWNNGMGNGGGGGGISSVWTIPSWQVGLSTAANKGSATMRNVPDVSLNADPSTGYAVFYGGAWTIVGGTSCAAPTWAAFTALINQQRQDNHLALLGFPNPSLYQLGQASNYSLNFHDIQDGSTNMYYPAVKGYDEATGWGSFQGSTLLNSLSAAPVVAPQPSPVSTGTSSGPGTSPSGSTPTPSSAGVTPAASPSPC